MSVTNKDKEKERLRKYLSPYIKGKTTDAILEALAVGNATHLVNNVSAVHDQLYISSASAGYLDALLAGYGITRPPQVGLSDDVYREIGIEVKNRKQVRDLIENILFHIFGDDYTKAVNSAKQYEPYNLKDGDTLIVNFDDKNTSTITFSASDFNNIAAATAQEVADVISKYLLSTGLPGSAVAQDDGNGPYVSIFSDTIGPQSLVTVLGGRAQNELLFDRPLPVIGSMTTQWTLSVQPGGIVRYTWTGGANPNIGKAIEGGYVNIFGGGFAANPENEGSYDVTNFRGGSAGQSFFEIYNPFGTNQTVVQGNDTAVLFFFPVRKTVQSKKAYATVYQSESRTLNIFLPASTKVIRRDRKGAAHLHDQPLIRFTLNVQPDIGDSFAITDSITLVAGTHFSIGSTIRETIDNMVVAINTYSGLKAFNNATYITVFQNDINLILDGTYTGSQDIVGSGPEGDVQSLMPDQDGPYIYDLQQPFVVSDIFTTLSQDLDGTMSRVVQVSDSSKFPDEQGNLIINYGWQEQEGPIPYIARPSNNTLLISPAYTIKNKHKSGSEISLVAQKGTVQISQSGEDMAFYVTDTVAGRIYAQDLINQTVATGINVIVHVLYPGSEGFGKWDKNDIEIEQIWGP